VRTLYSSLKEKDEVLAGAVTPENYRYLSPCAKMLTRAAGYRAHLMRTGQDFAERRRIFA